MYLSTIVASVAALVAVVSANVPLGGVSIAGFEFGCVQDGSCHLDRAFPPLKPISHSDGQGDGIGQMQHFAADRGFNTFRLPVGWQFLVENQLGGGLSPTNFKSYDKLVQACLDTGSHCVVDIHNYARWDGGIIGQGGPTNDHFVSLWSQLAAHYASSPRVVMSIMNEPHDIPNLDKWAMTLQAVVHGIRNAGATSQLILLSGTEWQSAHGFLETGSAETLHNITNPDGTTTNLAFDVHQYFDADFSGTHAECKNDNLVDRIWKPVSEWLRANGRQALWTETSGGNDNPVCLEVVCQALDFINANSDVFLGFVAWSAGSFAADQQLTLTPSGSADVGWTDGTLLKKCYEAKFHGNLYANIHVADASDAATNATNPNNTTASSTPTSARRSASSRSPDDTSCSSGNPTPMPPPGRPTRRSVF